MGPTRRRDLTAAAIVTALVCHLLVHVLYRWFPPITVWGGLSLLTVAIAEAGWGQYVRTKISDGQIGPGANRLHPLAVARSVIVAKASAWMGALVLGFWAGVLGYLLPRRSVLRVAAEDTPGTVTAVLGSLALLIAALWLQHCCKSPQDPAEPDPSAGNQLGWEMPERGDTRSDLGPVQSGHARPGRCRAER